MNESYLRFDFSHFEKVKDEDLAEIERIVNQKIIEAVPLNLFEDVPIDEAKAMGAAALFGEKYGEKVRVVQFAGEFSTELCGGTHVGNTIEIRYFKMMSESSISAGIRSIEALTSDEAIAFLENRVDVLERLRRRLKNCPDPEKRVTDLLEENKKMQEKLERARQQALNELRDKLLNEAEPAGPHYMLVRQVEVNDGAELKQLAFELRKQMKETVIVLGALANGKPLLTVILTEDLGEKPELDAKAMVNDLAKSINGGGGGQPFYATAGGKKPEGLPEALARAKAFLTENISA